jgi:G:T-mismatch repair DNA endonuclease (very short patch repair protein)
VAALATLGWRVFTVWQCQTKDRPALRQRIVEFLSAS